MHHSTKHRGKSPRSFRDEARFELLDQDDDIARAVEATQQLVRTLAHIRRRNHAAVLNLRAAQDAEDRKAGIDLYRLPAGSAA